MTPHTGLLHIKKKKTIQQTNKDTLRQYLTQLRTELGNRLVELVYVDGTPSKVLFFSFAVLLFAFFPLPFLNLFYSNNKKKKKKKKSGGPPLPKRSS